MLPSFGDQCDILKDTQKCPDREFFQGRIKVAQISLLT
jgi:hypothetical protein